MCALLVGLLRFFVKERGGISGGVASNARAGAGFGVVAIMKDLTPFFHTGHLDGALPSGLCSELYAGVAIGANETAISSAIST